MAGLLKISFLSASAVAEWDRRFSLVTVLAPKRSWRRSAKSLLSPDSLGGRGEAGGGVTMANRFL